MYKAVFLFTLGIASFATASTSGESDVFIWLIGAMGVLSGAALMVMDSAREGVR